MDDDKIIFVVLAEHKDKRAIAVFDDGEKAMKLFNKYGTQITRINVGDINNSEAELSALQDLGVE